MTFNQAPYGWSSIALNNPNLSQTANCGDIIPDQGTIHAAALIGVVCQGI